MKWGLITRPEVARGLGVQGWGIYQNLQPDSVLIVNTSDNYEKDFQRYASAWVTDFRDGKLSEEFVKDWMSDLDVVLSVETIYDPRLLDWAAQTNTKTIIQGNAEFVRPDQPQPDQWWWPTSWRLDSLPNGRQVSVPITLHDFVQLPDDNQSIKFLHVGGKRALGDRNGTDVFANVLSRVRGKMDITVSMQGSNFADTSRKPNVKIVKDIEDMNSLYSEHHVLVIPRRYGGLCLPVLEAIGHGMTVIMTDVSPNTDWPIYPVPCEKGAVLSMPCGRVTTFNAQLPDLAASMIALTNNRKELERYMSMSREYAEANSWFELKQMYYDELELVHASDFSRNRVSALPKSLTSHLAVVAGRVKRN